MESGDRIITGENASVQMYCFGGQGKVEIGENTILAMNNNEGILGLVIGEINLRVRKIKEKVKEYIAKDCFGVCTPTAILGIRGTEFAVFVDKTKATDIIVFEGSVEVKGINKKNDKSMDLVKEGNKVHINSQGHIEAIKKISK